MKRIYLDHIGAGGVNPHWRASAKVISELAGRENVDPRAAGGPEIEGRGSTPEEAIDRLFARIAMAAMVVE